jgi:hypothetical protein
VSRTVGVMGAELLGSLDSLVAGHRLRPAAFRASSSL